MGWPMHVGRALLITLALVVAWFAPPAFAPPTDSIVDREATGCVNPAHGAAGGWVESGCCYGNGGVCGCSAFGPVVCCDGRLNPTCLCRDGSPVTILASNSR
jgi:hypothetical protein